MVSRAWNAAALAGAALYLAVLPFVQVAALRSVALVTALAASLPLWRWPGRHCALVLAAFGVWLAAAAVSLVSTRDLSASLEAIENEVLRSCLVFLVFYMLARRAPSWHPWALATAAGALLISTLAVAYVLTGGGWGGPYVPTVGLFATSATTALVFMAGYLGLPGRDARVAMLTAGAIAMALLAGYLTYRRAFGFVLVAVALLAIVLHAAQKRRLGWRASLVLVFGCATGFALWTAAAVHNQKTLADSWDREHLYSQVARKIADNPATGTGYGHETDKPWYAARFPANYSVFHAHNLILSYLDQMGAAGAIALLAVFGLPAFAFARNLRHPSPRVGMAALCGLALLGCVFLRNNFDFFFTKHNLWMFFAYIGIFIGELDAASDSKAAMTSATGMSRTSRVAG